MHIHDIFDQKIPSLSFEFFPPKTEEGAKTLFSSIKELMPLKPAYVSVTYGAGGSTRKLTHDLVLKIHQETDLIIVAHLTCVAATKNEIYTILEDYEANGIQNIMALRGDPPHGDSDFKPVKDGFQHAVDLVRFIKKHFPKMGIGVAGFPEGHPECPNRLKEMDYLKEKVDAGADYICTQLFFNNQDFYDYRDRCHLAGVTIPIVAGIMPITSRKGMLRMSELALGSRFPAPLLKAIARAEDDDSISRVGVQWATEQVRDLIDNNVKGVHFYTLNRSKSTLNIYEDLGVQNSDSFLKPPSYIGFE